MEANNTPQPSSSGLTRGSTKATKTIDIMIDIETLGTRPGSVIASIGACCFCPQTREFIWERYWAISMQSCVDIGLTMDAQTVAWWLTQSPEAQRALIAGETDIATALAELKLMLTIRAYDRIWAKPPSFDLVLLESAFRACGQPIPWDFRKIRDCRTLFDISQVAQVAPTFKHHALSDAIAQAETVMNALPLLEGPTTDVALLPVSSPVAWRWRRADFEEWVLTYDQPPSDGRIIEPLFHHALEPSNV